MLARAGLISILSIFVLEIFLENCFCESEIIKIVRQFGGSKRHEYVDY